jgi:hypothetical protein
VSVSVHGSQAPPIPTRPHLCTDNRFRLTSLDALGFEVALCRRKSVLSLVTEPQLAYSVKISTGPTFLGIQHKDSASFLLVPAPTDDNNSPDQVSAMSFDVEHGRLVFALGKAYRSASTTTCSPWRLPMSGAAAVDTVCESHLALTMG